MIIKQIAIGNNIEGFIEDSFSNGFNIILSEDNNKGKTIVIQSILYALGNEPPAFPASFEYKKYIYILQFEEDGKEYWICRKNNEFIIYNNNFLFLAESISEFKRYWDKNIFSLPRIIINNIERIVDPSLLLQLFFVGQDKKSTDNIENRGLYKKIDFYNTIYEIMGLGSIKLNQEELDLVKKRLQTLKEEKSSLIKQHKLLKSKKYSTEFLSSIKDKIAFANKIKQMEEIKEEILNLKKERNKCINRKLNWEKTIKELNSLNRTIEIGELRCMDCNSTNILYKGRKKDSFSFDVSTVEMRKRIIASINEKIESYEEESQRYSFEIQKKQEIFRKILWLCHNKQLINIHFYRGVSELPYKLLFAVIYTHLEFRYEVSHTITSHHVHHFHQTRIPDGTLLDYMVQYRKPLFPQFFLYPKKFLSENNPHHKEFHLRPYIQNNANQ